MALGHGLQLLFPSSESRKPTPEVPTEGQTGLVQCGVICGRWYCTAGLIPVTGDPWMPSGCFCPDCSAALLEGKAEGEDSASPLQMSPHCPDSCL